MTKRKVPRLFSVSHYDLENNIANVVLQINNQISTLSGDVADLMDNGVTLTENIASDVRDYTVNSGEWVDLAKPRNRTALGANILITNGAVVSSFASELTAVGSVRMKLVLEPSPSTIRIITYAK